MGYESRRQSGYAYGEPKEGEQKGVVRKEKQEHKNSGGFSPEFLCFIIENAINPIAAVPVLC